MNIEDLIEGSECEFRVCAENEAGVGSPSETTGPFKVCIILEYKKFYLVNLILHLGMIISMILKNIIFEQYINMYISV